MKFRIFNIRKQKTETPVITVEEPTIKTNKWGNSEFYMELITTGKDYGYLAAQQWLKENEEFKKSVETKDTTKIVISTAPNLLEEATPPLKTIYKDLSDVELSDNNYPSPRWDNPIEALLEFVGREAQRENSMILYAAVYFIRFRIMTDPRFWGMFVEKDVEHADRTLRHQEESYNFPLFNWSWRRYGQDTPKPKVYRSF